MVNRQQSAASVALGYKKSVVYTPATATVVPESGTLAPQASFVGMQDFGPTLHSQNRICILARSHVKCMHIQIWKAQAISQLPSHLKALGL